MRPLVEEAIMTDNLTPQQRSYCMSRVKGKDTSLERLVRTKLHRMGLRFRKHARDIPGKPDILFPSARVAVFLDGDFWHGYQFPRWRHTVSEFWQFKIEGNRIRDQRTFVRLRRMDWKVIRIWAHDVKGDLDNVAAMIARTVEVRGKRGGKRAKGGVKGDRLLFRSITTRRIPLQRRSSLSFFLRRFTGRRGRRSRGCRVLPCGRGGGRPSWSCGSSRGSRSCRSFRGRASRACRSRAG